MNWKSDLPAITKIINSDRLGLVTDVDGTISPIVDQPDQAQVDSGIRETLAALTELLPLVAVVSGRAAGDVSARVGVAGVVYIGNHGLERLLDGQVVPDKEVLSYRPALQAAAEEINPILYPGMMVEDKVVTLSVHYRMAEDHAAVESLLYPLISNIANRHGLKLFSGRKVYELRPPIAVDKGSAFRSLVADYRLGAAFYLGDDTTDGAALQAAGELRRSGNCQAYGIGVGGPDMPPVVRRYSDWTASGVEDVAEFLSLLRKSLSASST